MDAGHSHATFRASLFRFAAAALAAALIPLLLAGCEKPADRARRLLEANNIAFTADDFVDAAGRGDAETVRLFIEAGMDTGSMDTNGYTALMRAAEQGNTEVVQILISAGANLDAQGIEGVTALMQAAQFNRLEVVRALISAGADLRPVDEKGWSALMKAIYRGHDRIVEAMLPHAPNEAAQALVLASVLGQRKVVETLLAGGAPPDAAIEKGQTALMLAAARGNEEIVRALLAGGAQPLAADAEGKTASMIAAARGHRNLARLLQQAEAGKLPPPPPPPPPAPEPSADFAAVRPPDAAPEPQTAGAQPAVTVTPAPSPGPKPEPEPAPVPVAPRPAPEPPAPVVVTEPEPAAPPAAAAELLASQPEPPSPAPESSALPKLRLAAYNQDRVPIVLTAISGGIGQFRTDDGGELYARQGDPLGDGRFVVLSLRERRIIDKDGSAVDASEARVKDTATGREHRLVKDLPSRASRDSAVLAVEGPGPAAKITVKVGEEFFIPGDPSTLYRLVEARNDMAVVRVVDTGETFNVTR